MRPAIRVSLSLFLLLFASCQSPAQEDTAPADNGSQAAATAPNSELDQGFAGEVDAAAPAPTTPEATGPGATTPDATTPDTTSPTTLAADEESADVVREEQVAPQELTMEVAAQGDPRDEKIFQLTERVASLETELQELKQRLRQLQDVERELANLRDAISNLELASNDQNPGRRALGAMSESPQLRGEIAEQLQGKVRLVNNTGQPQVVYINGTPWTVIQGRSFVFAPIGTVSIQRLGEAEPIFKGVHEWEANSATDDMELVIDLSDPQGRSVVTQRRDLDDPATPNP